jgi:hypothetical protein
MDASESFHWSSCVRPSTLLVNGRLHVKARVNPMRLEQIGKLKLDGRVIAKDRITVILESHSKCVPWRAEMLITTAESVAIEIVRHKVFQIELDDGRTLDCCAEWFSPSRYRDLWIQNFKGVGPLSKPLSPRLTTVSAFHNKPT